MPALYYKPFYNYLYYKARYYYTFIVNKRLSIIAYLN